jgi:hypothetical protein
VARDELSAEGPPSAVLDGNRAVRAPDERGEGLTEMRRVERAGILADPSTFPDERCEA